MDFFSDGRLAISTWDAEGAVYVLDGVTSGDPSKISYTKVATGLAEPLGLKVVNDTIYVLSAGIWTDDVNVAHRAARAIRAGIVWVNTFDAGDISSPFGGFKQSGFGRDKSIHALDKFTDLKAIWIALRD